MALTTPMISLFVLSLAVLIGLSVYLIIQHNKKEKYMFDKTTKAEMDCIHYNMNTAGMDLREAAKNCLSTDPVSLDTELDTAYIERALNPPYN